MGVPFAIILMIVLIMTMFAIAAIIIYKNRETFGNQKIDLSPSSLNSSSKKNPKH